MNLLFANDKPGEYPDSLYAQTRVYSPERAQLRGEIRADVVVIGAGYTGLSAALHLAEAGRKVVVLEAHRIGFGASGRNGGQLGSGQRLDVNELEAMAGKAAARRLWDMAEEAKALTRDLARRSDVAVHDGIAHACRNRREVDAAARQAEKLAREYDYDLVQPLDREAFHALVPSRFYQGGDVDRGAGHLHPLNLVIGIAGLAEQAGTIIYENSTVTGIRHGTTTNPGTVATSHGSVIADNIIIAANGYLGDLDRQMGARVMPINNYIIATEPLGKRRAEVLAEDIAVADTKFVVNYWRLSRDGRLVFGGGETVSYRFPSDIAGKVRKHMLEVYPKLADIGISHAWGGTLAITRTRLPCFIRPAANTLAAGGFSGHGVGMANLAGKLMAQAVIGQSEGFELFENLPTPRFPGGAALRWPLLIAGMSWFSLRDRIGW